MAIGFGVPRCLGMCKKCYINYASCAAGNNDWDYMKLNRKGVQLLLNNPAIKESAKERLREDHPKWCKERMGCVRSFFKHIGII